MLAGGGFHLLDQRPRIRPLEEPGEVVRVVIAPAELLVGQNPPQQRDIGANAGDPDAAQVIREFLDGSIPVVSVHDDLGHHAVVVRRNELAAARGGDDLHPFLFRKVGFRDLAWMRPERKLAVRAKLHALRIDPRTTGYAIDGVARRARLDAGDRLT